jgi:hypothetical protein
MLLVMGAKDMVTPHLGRNESCILMHKRKRILGLRQNINCPRHNSRKELRPALT